MIPSFEIKNYRLFKHLVIEKLRRVNLITGKNNVGKTALLEALRLYIHLGSIEMLQIILSKRNELSGESIKAIKYLFHNYNFEDQKIIKLGPIANEEEILQIYFDIVHDTTIEALKNETLKKDIPRLFIHIGNFEHGFNLKNDVLLKDFSSYSLDRNDVDFFVSSVGISDKQINEWWDNITLSPNEDYVIDGLKMIEPKIEKISLVSQNQPKDKRIFRTKIKGMTDPIPLNTMGEGLNRFLGICLTLINAKGGVLLIDEIENGIHYTIQPKLWKLILGLAEKLNVQVFATTHSWDAVEGFQKALNDFHDPDQGQIIRLDEFDGEISTTIFNAKELTIATRNSIEVR